jgi:hypothetical protein
MARTTRRNALRELQTGLPRGVPFDIQTAKSKGVSSALAWHYLKSGWVERLERGVFMFPNDRLERDACLKFTATRIPGLHVGGKTALAWRGVRHHVSPREHLVLWGDARRTLPEWLTSRFPCRYVSKNLFSKKLPPGFGLQSLPETPDGPLVSVPERALLEMLSDVGLHQGIEEARHLMEGLRALRPEVLATLLKNCLRVKVRRLCVQWAEELNLGWAGAARKSGRLGKGRWSTRLRDGTTLTLKP